MRTIYLFLFLSVSFASLVAQTTNHTVMVSGLQRSYVLYSPNKNYGVPKPLILFYHGRGGKASVDDYVAKADSHNVYVAALQGVDSRWTFEGDTTSTVGPDDVEFTNIVLNDIMKIRKIDSGKVSAFGFSNGSAFANYLGSRLSERIASIACIGATMPLSELLRFRARYPMPVIMIYGTNDPNTGMDGSRPRGGALMSAKENIDIWVKHNKNDSTPKVIEFPDLVKKDSTSITSFEYLNGNAPVVLLKINGGEHTFYGMSRDNGNIRQGSNYDIDFLEYIFIFLLSANRNINPINGVHDSEFVKATTMKLVEN